MINVRMEQEKSPTHGTNNTYVNYGCRCLECKAANKAYRHSRMALCSEALSLQRDELQSALPEPGQEAQSQQQARDFSFRRGRGASCPRCESLKYRDEGSYRKCGACGFIGWAYFQRVQNVGSGRGNRCPDCHQLTFHDIVTLPRGGVVLRCATCNYTGIEPAQGLEQDPSIRRVA
jgi:hypothetical protein